LLDAVGWQKDKPKNEYYIGFICEWKGTRSATKQTFEDEEKGQLVSYLAALSRFQPNRPDITGTFISQVFTNIWRLP
jgi:hypothetical protein